MADTEEGCGGMKPEEKGGGSGRCGCGGCGGCGGAPIRPPMPGCGANCSW